MNVLIDTNILISLEDTSRTLDPKLAEMCRLSEKNGHILYLHPLQVEDILRDKNEERRKILLSRIKLYQTIPSPPLLPDCELQKYGWRQSSDNDRIDNLLLHALCRGAVHFLVTNDRDIHKKARAAQVQEQVHLPDQFLAFLSTQSAEELPPFGIKECFLHEFNVKQTFFDSLREGYNGFDNWYLNAAKGHRKAWCIYSGEILDAICIFQHEENPVIVNGGKPLVGASLKLCTFKVGERLRGRKIGERFLFSAFKYAAKNKIQYVYLHTFGKEHHMLVNLCLEYGFEFAGKHENKRDDVYIKEMIVPNNISNSISPLDYMARYYPHFLDTEVVEKFIVPIQPVYHNNLFVDTCDDQYGLFADDSVQYSPQSNTIKKAYICHANTKSIKPGSLLLFFRTQDRMSIECMGIVEQTYRGSEFDKVMPLVSKRSVYSEDEIKKWLLKDTLVILFRYVPHFLPISRKVLENAGIKGAIQSIRKISHSQYKLCFQRNNK